MLDTNTYFLEEEKKRDTQKHGEKGKKKKVLLVGMGMDMNVLGNLLGAHLSRAILIL